MCMNANKESMGWDNNKSLQLIRLIACFLFYSYRKNIFIDAVLLYQ